MIILRVLLIIAFVPLGLILTAIKASGEFLTDLAEVLIEVMQDATSELSCIKLAERISDENRALKEKLTKKEDMQNE